jgi:hypothetical protein
VTTVVEWARVAVLPDHREEFARDLADHTEGFRGGPLFAEWRALIGSHFAGPPVIVHYAV